MNDPSTREPTMIFGWANAIAQALEMEGIDSKQLFEQAGIPLLPTTDPSSRMETRKATELYRLTVKASNNPAFGLKVALCVQPLTLYALGYSLFASSTLYDLCRRLERYFRLASENAVHQLIETDGHYQLRLETTHARVSHEAIDAWLGFVVHTCRNIYQPGFRPIKVELMRPEPPSHGNDFTAFFHCPVYFSAEHNAIHFSKEDLFAPLPMADSELARRNDEVVIERLARLDRADIVRQVEAQIVKQLPTGECSKERVAKELNLSPGTLHHKLEKQHTSYQEILENLRSSLARQYMEQLQMPVSEITFLLGFSDTSNFSRAFRRWTGQSPSAFRQQFIKKP